MKVLNVLDYSYLTFFIQVYKPYFSLVFLCLHSNNTVGP